jgi:FKBP-type peptidyl-prolyl cis-trans isomerase FkpA
MCALTPARLKERRQGVPVDSASVVAALGSSMFRAALVLAMSVVVAACGEAPTEPSHFAPFSQTDLLLGTGEAAVSSNRLTVHYTLWLYDASAAGNRGVQIESSVGLTPFTFALGSGEVIQGWNQGLAGMRVGGRRRLVIPPSLAYGQNRNGIIPPNATLLFEIELMSVTTS